MLLNHNQSSLSFHSELYSFVPEDHLLRRVHELVDFSFINDLVKGSYCMYYGRPANDPELLFQFYFFNSCIICQMKESLRIHDIIWPISGS